MITEFVCDRCGVVVEVPTHKVLMAAEKVAIANRLCNSCFGDRKVNKDLDKGA